MDASRAGKDVTVVIELRARFDEEANINLATRLQEAGIQVVYGVVGFKTHAKMLLVVRQEKTKLVKYAHVGTGNYHATTARLYTDISMLTCHKRITNDIHKIFTQLTGLGQTLNLKEVVQAPFSLHRFIIDKIEEQIAVAESGGSRSQDQIIDSGCLYAKGPGAGLVDKYKGRIGSWSVSGTLQSVLFWCRQQRTALHKQC